MFWSISLRDTHLISNTFGSLLECSLGMKTRDSDFCTLTLLCFSLMGLIFFFNSRLLFFYFLFLSQRVPFLFSLCLTPTSEHHPLTHTRVSVSPRGELLHTPSAQVYVWCPGCCGCCQGNFTSPYSGSQQSLCSWLPQDFNQ